MEKLAQILNAQVVEVSILFAMLLSIVLVYFFNKLPMRKNSIHYRQDRTVRGFYCCLWGVFFLWLIYSITEVVGIILLGFVFFYMSKLVTSLKRYFIINCIVFFILFLAHFHRYIIHGDNPDYYGFGFILMILIPRVMYFNRFMYQKHNIENMDKNHRRFRTFKIDIDVWEMDIELRHFFGYYLNFLGIFMPPVTNFIEYRHFLLGTFPYKVDFWRKTLKYLSFMFLLIFINQQTPKFWVFNQYQKPIFLEWSIPYQMFYIVVSSFLSRMRYCMAFIWGNMISILANLREQDFEYKEYQQMIDLWEMETNLNMKKRLPAWNISIAKWLRATVYEPILEIGGGKNQGQFITNMFSGFWHGCFPSYYVSFFMANVIISIEKTVYIKNIPYFPKIFYYFYMDLGMAIFKAFRLNEMKNVFWNCKLYFIIFILVSIFVFTYQGKKTKTKVNQFEQKIILFFTNFFTVKINKVFKIIFQKKYQ